MTYLMREVDVTYHPLLAPPLVVELSDLLHSSPFLPSRASIALVFILIYTILFVECIIGQNVIVLIKSLLNHFARSVHELKKLIRSSQSIDLLVRQTPSWEFRWSFR